MYSTFYLYTRGMYFFLQLDTKVQRFPAQPYMIQSLNKPDRWLSGSFRDESYPSAQSFPLYRLQEEQKTEHCSPKVSDLFKFNKTVKLLLLSLQFSPLIHHFDRKGHVGRPCPHK